MIMDETSRDIVRKLLTEEWDRVNRALMAADEEMRPLRVRLGQITQALEDYGFQNRLP